MAQRLSRSLTPAGTSSPRRVFAFNSGSFTNTRVRQILKAAGLAPHVGWPTPDDAILAWGYGRAAGRAEWIARKTGARLLRLEDAFYRSVLTGRAGDAPIGLLIDSKGCHFDSGVITDIENILQNDPLHDPLLMERAQSSIAQIKDGYLSKYNANPLDALRPEPGFVLVIDQTRGDASIRKSGADANTFAKMLIQAKQDHPRSQIIIKTHPETIAGHRNGHFTEHDLRPGDLLWDHPTPVQYLFEGAKAVYSVSSQMGFEAILHGHKPQVFGQPFYMGWGLTVDHAPLTRRNRTLSVYQLFAAACLIYPKWFDPFTDQICDFETAVRNLSAQTRAWRDDHKGWSAPGMRLWKRNHLRNIFGKYGGVKFRSCNDRPQMTWGASDGTETTHRLEDGFLRSKGLGAALVPPMSLVLDDVGIYFDATRPSRLESLIADSIHLSDDALTRASELASKMRDQKLSKYNLPGTPIPKLPKGHKILVPGQVEDDASILFGTTHIRTNASLLQAVRKANPNALILYKPHPDVEAGLRTGHVPNALDWADFVLTQTDPITAILNVDAVHTMTSLLGFEALLHNVPVTCYGHPFYAGWGLTDDQTPHARRNAKPTLAGLIHATLIDYPRYYDPITKLACPPEVTVDRLSQATLQSTGIGLRLLSKLQGIFATYAHWWR